MHLSNRPVILVQYSCYTCLSRLLLNCTANNGY
nr:MAG TPA: hypothetical protein [Bacteriophage sp.]DAO65326.1 MAG TPA: hypothetical protein [Caudoviricetes sp.]